MILDENCKKITLENVLKVRWTKWKRHTAKDNNCSYFKKMKRVNVHSCKMTHICSTGYFKSKCIPKLASKGFEPYSAYEDQFMREN